VRRFRSEQLRILPVCTIEEGAEAILKRRLQRATTTSVQEIDKLITELQTLRDVLHSEGARLQREIVEYSTLTTAALHSTKIIERDRRQLVHPGGFGQAGPAARPGAQGRSDWRAGQSGQYSDRRGHAARHTG
jgi:hypothetical protein